MMRLGIYLRDELIRVIVPDKMMLWYYERRGNFKVSVKHV